MFILGLAEPFYVLLFLLKKRLAVFVEKLIDSRLVAIIYRNRFFTCCSRISDSRRCGMTKWRWSFYELLEGCGVTLEGCARHADILFDCEHLGHPTLWLKSRKTFHDAILIRLRVLRVWTLRVHEIDVDCRLLCPLLLIERRLGIAFLVIYKHIAMRIEKAMSIKVDFFAFTSTPHIVRSISCCKCLFLAIKSKFLDVHHANGFLIMGRLNSWHFYFSIPYWPIIIKQNMTRWLVTITAICSEKLSYDLFFVRVLVAKWRHLSRFVFYITLGLSNSTQTQPIGLIITFKVWWWNLQLLLLG